MKNIIHTYLYSEGVNANNSVPPTSSPSFVVERDTAQQQSWLCSTSIQRDGCIPAKIAIPTEQHRGRPMAHRTADNAAHTTIHTVKTEMTAGTAVGIA